MAGAFRGRKIASPGPFAQSLIPQFQPLVTGSFAREKGRSGDVLWVSQVTEGAYSHRYDSQNRLAGRSSRAWNPSDFTVRRSEEV
jgi:hypothetical protein